MDVFDDVEGFLDCKDSGRGVDSLLAWERRESVGLRDVEGGGR